MDITRASEPIYECVGLNAWARAFVRGTPQEARKITALYFKNGWSRIVSSEKVVASPVEKTVYAHFGNRHQGDVHPLHIYRFPDNRTVVENVWEERGAVDGHLCIFLALKERNVWLPESLWTEKDMRLCTE